MLRCGMIALLALPAWGQAVVESALGAGRAAATAAPAQKIGNAVAGIAGTLGKTAAASATAPTAGRTTRVTLPSSSKQVAPAKPARQYEDPKGIEEGMSYEDVVGRFGPPLMQIATGALSKSLSYTGVQAEVEDGKVVAVTRPGGSDARAAVK